MKRFAKWLLGKIFWYRYYDWNEFISMMQNKFPYMIYDLEKSCDCGKCHRIMAFYEIKSRDNNNLLFKIVVDHNKLKILYYDKNKKCIRCGRKNSRECARSISTYKKRPYFKKRKIDEYVLEFISKHII